VTGRYSSTNDMGEFSIWALVITIVVFVCVAFLAVGFGFLNIPLKGLERQAIQQSPGYVEAKQHTLIDLKAQYLRLETDASTKYAGNDDAVKSIHSQQRQIAALRRAMPEALVEIHPETGAARGIADGDRIAIETPHGRFVARARLSSKQAVDVVCAQYGWWRTENGEPASYNAAIDGETFDPLSGSNGLRAYLCEARRLVPAVASAVLGQ